MVQNILIFSIDHNKCHFCGLLSACMKWFLVENISRHYWWNLVKECLVGNICRHFWTNLVHDQYILIFGLDYAFFVEFSLHGWNYFGWKYQQALWPNLVHEHLEHHHIMPGSLKGKGIYFWLIGKRHILVKPLISQSIWAQTSKVRGVLKSSVIRLSNGTKNFIVWRMWPENWHFCACGQIY